jgi:glycosyltransferase involved in cell wall biosynthesis
MGFRNDDSLGLKGNPQRLDVNTLAKYSICITHYNNLSTLKMSLDSVLSQIDGTVEVVVVDNYSNDGSEVILEDYFAERKIKLLKKKCSRGIGRQLAFQSSLGDYVISHIDMDDIYDPLLVELLDFYKRKCDGAVLVAISAPGNWTQNVTVATREVLTEVGGWRDVGYADDWDLWSRAARVGKYAWTVFPLVKRTGTHRSRGSFIGKFSYRFHKYLDELRLGRNVFSRGERTTSMQRTARILARIALPFYVSYSDDFNKTFYSADPRFFVTDDTHQVDRPQVGFST